MTFLQGDYRFSRELPATTMASWNDAGALAKLHHSTGLVPDEYLPGRLPHYRHPRPLGFVPTPGCVKLR